MMTKSGDIINNKKFRLIDTLQGAGREYERRQEGRSVEPCYP